MTGRPGGLRRRSLVIQTAHLGDVVLTLPLLQHLAARGGPVDVVTTPVAAPLLIGQPSVAEVLPFDKYAGDAGPGGLWRMAARLRARKYAVAWLPHRSFRTGALAWLAGIPERVGFRGSPGTPWYTHRVVLPATGHQTARLAALAGAEPAAPPWFVITPTAAVEAERWLAAAGVTSPFVVVAPGARWGTKRWPGYPELAVGFRLPIVVVGSDADRELGASIVAATGGRARQAAGALSLPATAAVIARSSLVVSNDSLPLHLAGGLGRPVVAVFGPTVPAFGFGPLGPADRIVEVGGLACRPCSPHGPDRCPLGHHRCMRELPVAAVGVAVAERLAGSWTGNEGSGR